MWARAKWLEAKMVLAFILISGAAPGFAGQICWVEKVEKDADGLRVYFNGNSLASIVVKRPDGRDDAYNLSKGKVIEPSFVRRLFGGFRRPEFEFLLLKNGDQAQLTQGEHDRCTLSVIEEALGLGLKAEASFTPHGLPAAQASAVIRPGAK
jgi:hypothetical protein